MSRLRAAARVLLGLGFVVAGINHFVNPAVYEPTIPPYIPAPALMVALSGFAEVGLGAAVLLPATRRLGGWGLIALLVAVFPANLHMALHPAQFPQVPAWALWARLPLQALLIGLVKLAVLDDQA